MQCLGQYAVCHVSNAMCHDISAISGPGGHVAISSPCWPTTCWPCSGPLVPLVGHFKWPLMLSANRCLLLAKVRMINDLTLTVFNTGTLNGFKGVVNRG